MHFPIRRSIRCRDIRMSKALVVSNCCTNCSLIYCFIALFPIAQLAFHCQESTSEIQKNRLFSFVSAFKERKEENNGENAPFRIEGVEFFGFPKFFRSFEIPKCSLSRHVLFSLSTFFEVLAYRELEILQINSIFDFQIFQRVVVNDSICG